MAERMPYEDTTVNPASSMGHIRDLCLRYGADAVQFSDDLKARCFQVAMMMDGLPLRLTVDYGTYQRKLVENHPRSDTSTLDRQAERTAWRWAYYHLKLVFEADALGFLPKQLALLAGFVGPDGRTVGETIGGRLPEWHLKGEKVLRLPAATVIEANFEGGD